MNENEYQHILKLVDEYEAACADCTIQFEETGSIADKYADMMASAREKLENYLWLFVEDD